MLAGNRTACALIPARKKTYDRYKSLPPYPPFIRGRFDPFEWAADPDHMTDYCDATAAVRPQPSDRASGEDITGFAGSVGRID